MLRLTNRYIGPPRGTGVLPRPVKAVLARTGGIISTRELHRLGVDPTTLEILRDAGSLQSVRQGWHCTPETPAIIRLAWRFGGPLACVSALAYHDALESADPRLLRRDGPSRGPGELPGVAEPLHVCLRGDAVSPPAPTLLARRWGGAEPLRPVLHWSSVDHASGDRRAVARDVAARQAARCRQRVRARPSAGAD